jgi:hypothetical protein
MTSQFVAALPEGLFEQFVPEIRERVTAALVLEPGCLEYQRYKAGMRKAPKERIRFRGNRQLP